MKRIMGLSILVLLASQCLVLKAFSQTHEQEREALKEQADLQLELRNAREHPELANQSGPLYIPPRQDKIITLARKVFPELGKLKADAEVKAELDRKYPKYEVDGRVIQSGGPSQMLQDPAFLKYAKQHPDQVTREALNTPAEIGAVDRSIQQRDLKLRNLKIETSQLQRQIKENNADISQDKRDVAYRQDEILALKAQIQDVEAQIRRLGGKPDDHCVKPGESEVTNGYLINGVSPMSSEVRVGEQKKTSSPAVTRDGRFKELKPALSEVNEKPHSGSGARGINRSDSQ